MSTNNLLFSFDLVETESFSPFFVTDVVEQLYDDINQSSDLTFYHKKQFINIKFSPGTNINALKIKNAFVASYLKDINKLKNEVCEDRLHFEYASDNNLPSVKALEDRLNSSMTKLCKKSLETKYDLMAKNNLYPGFKTLNMEHCNKHEFGHPEMITVPEFTYVIDCNCLLLFRCCDADCPYVVVRFLNTVKERIPVFSSVKLKFHEGTISNAISDGSHQIYDCFIGQIHQTDPTVGLTGKVENEFDPVYNDDNLNVLSNEESYMMSGALNYNNIYHIFLVVTNLSAWIRKVKRTIVEREKSSAPKRPFVISSHTVGLADFFKDIDVSSEVVDFETSDAPGAELIPDKVENRLIQGLDADFIYLNIIDFDIGLFFSSSNANHHYKIVEHKNGESDYTNTMQIICAAEKIRYSPLGVHNESLENLTRYFDEQGVKVVILNQRESILPPILDAFTLSTLDDKKFVFIVVRNNIVYPLVRCCVNSKGKAVKSEAHNTLKKFLLLPNFRKSPISLELYPSDETMTLYNTNKNRGTAKAIEFALRSLNGPELLTAEAYFSRNEPVQFALYLRLKRGEFSEPSKFTGQGHESFTSKLSQLLAGRHAKKSEVYAPTPVALKISTSFADRFLQLLKEKQDRAALVADTKEKQEEEEKGREEGEKLGSINNEGSEKSYGGEQDDKDKFDEIDDNKDQEHGEDNGDGQDDAGGEESDADEGCDIDDVVDEIIGDFEELADYSEALKEIPVEKLSQLQFEENCSQIFFRDCLAIYGVVNDDPEAKDQMEEIFGDNKDFEEHRTIIERLSVQHLVEIAQKEDEALEYFKAKFLGIEKKDEDRKPDSDSEEKWGYMKSLTNQRLIETMLENIRDRKCIDYAYSFMDDEQIAMYDRALTIRAKKVIEEGQINRRRDVKIVKMITWVSEGPFTVEDNILVNGIISYPIDIDTASEDGDDQSEISAHVMSVGDLNTVDDVVDLDERFEAVVDVLQKLTPSQIDKLCTEDDAWEFYCATFAPKEEEQGQTDETKLEGSNQDSEVAEIDILEQALSTDDENDNVLDDTFQEIQICRTCYVDKQPVIQRLASIYPGLEGGVINLFNISCYLSMYKEHITVANYFADLYYKGTLDDHEIECWIQTIKNSFKFRHDLWSSIISNLFMKYHSPIFGTDVAFCEVFDFMESKKTPDFIHVDGNKVIIIETSVSSDYRKSVIQKGTDVNNSKYKEQIDQVILKGYEVDYFTFYLDVTTGESSYDELKLKFYEWNLSANIEFVDDYHDMVLNCIKTNRGIEKFGYIVFSKETVSWNSDIKNSSAYVQKLFLDKIKAKKSNPLRYNDFRANKHALDMVQLSQESIVHKLYSPSFDEFKVAIYVSRNSAEVRKNLQDGMDPAVLMNHIISHDFQKVLRHTFVQGKDKYDWIKATEKGPFVTVSTDNVIEDNLEEFEPHDHSLSAQEADLKYVESEHSKLRANYEAEKIDLTSYLQTYTKCLDEGILLCNKVVNDAEIYKACRKYAEARRQRLLESNHMPKASFELPYCEPCRMVKTQENISNFGFEHTALHKFVYRKFKENPASLIRKVPTDESIEKMKFWNNKYRVIVRELSTKYSDKNRLTKKEIKSLPNISLDDLEKFNEVYEGLVKTQKESKTKFVQSKVNYVRLPKHELDAVKSEYSWVNKKMSNISRNFSSEEGVSDPEDLFRQLITFLFVEQSNHDYTDEFAKYTDPGEDSNPMLMLKLLMMKPLSKILETIKGRNIILMADFVNQFVYTLTYLSKNRGRGDRFYYSNLGWENVNLFVRGGKTLNQIGESRQFRLSYPIPDFIHKNFSTFFSPSFVCEDIGGVKYILTPWACLNERVLADMINMKEKVIMNLATYLNRITLDAKTIHFENIGFNLLLMFNNKRSTETMLSDLRYPIVNSTGIYSDIDNLLGSFDHNPSDFIQYMILKKFDNFFEFYKKNNMKQNKDIDDGYHLFTGKPLMGKTDLTFLIYSTYMMTKAPYKQHVEQSRNLKGMMEIHGDYMKLMGSTKIGLDDVLKQTATNDPKMIFDNDFYYSPNFSFQLGKRLSKYIKTKKMINEVNNDFYTTFTDNWLTIENESGMRSDEFKNTGKHRFFGRKGHEVIAVELIERLKSMSPTEALNDIKDNVSDIFKKSQKLQDYDVSFVKAINSITETKFICHVVDKTQWKGSREVYVMTMKSKIKQNPLEVFFKKLSQKIENEIISIPSSKRSMLIHSQLFDNKYIKSSTVRFKRYNLSLDCRKWGPKTNFNKYLHMLLGASEILPPELIEYFAYFTEMYNGKQIYISKKAMEVFKNNAGNAEYLNYLEEDKDLKTFKFTMPYSFIMGLFNYLSSLFHALTQMEAIESIQKHIYETEGINIVMRMNAHSDDSAGYVLVPQQNKAGFDNDSCNERIIKKVIGLYETIMKYGNMFLSLKKCVVSEVYFELLSILYYHDQLLPMIPKFYGNMSLKPTMKGYPQDISQGYSKIIELIQNGATFDEAYLAMRIFSQMYRSMYHLHSNYDAGKPIAAYGGLYAHPLLVMLTGAKADNIRLYISDKSKFISYQATMMQLTGEAKETFKQEGLRPASFMKARNSVEETIKDCKQIYDIWVFPRIGDTLYSRLQNPSYFDLSYKSEDGVHVFSVKETNNDSMHLVSLSNKTVIVEIPDVIKITKTVFMNGQLTRLLTLCNNQLRDPDFVNSLSYVSNTRRITQTFTNASDIPLMTAIGYIKQRKAPFLIDALAIGSQYEEQLPIQFDVETLKALRGKTENLFEDILGEAKVIYSYISDSVTSDVYSERYRKNNRILMKPCHLHIQLNPESFTVKSDPDKIYYSDSPDVWILKPNKSLEREKTLIKARIISMGFKVDDQQLFVHYVRNFQKTYEKDMNFYGVVSQGNREIQDYESLLDLLETNSCYGSKLYKIYKNLKINYRFSSIETKMDPMVIRCLKLLKLHYHCVVNYKHESVLVNSVTIPYFVRNKTNSQCSLILPVREPQEMADLNYFYAWVKKQKKVDNKWVGSGQLFLNLPGCTIRAHIEKNILTKVFLDVNPEILESGPEISILFYLLNLMNIKVVNHLSGNSNKNVVTHDKILRVAKEFATDNNFCSIELDPGLKNFSKGRPRKINEFEYYCREMHFRHISCEVKLDMHQENISHLPEQLSRYYHKIDEEKTITMKDMITNLARTDIYKDMMYKKLEPDYNFKKILESACISRGLKFNDIAFMKIEEIIGMSINKDMLPDDLYWAVENSESYFKITDQYDEFLEDMILEFSKEKDDIDFTKLLTKWGTTAVSQVDSIVIRKNTKVVLDNPEVILPTQKSYAFKVLDILEAGIIDAVRAGFGSIWRTDDKEQFSQFHELTIKDFQNIFYLLRMEACTKKFHIKRGQSKLSEFLHICYIELFDSKLYFDIFRRRVETETETNSLPIDPGSAKKWAILHYTCCRQFDLDLGPESCLVKNVSQYEKVIRNVESKGHSLVGENSKNGLYKLMFMSLPCNLSMARRYKVKGMSDKRSQEMLSKTKFYTDTVIPDVHVWPGFKFNITEHDDIELKQSSYLAHVSPMENKKVVERCIEEKKCKVTLKSKPASLKNGGVVKVIETIGHVNISQIASYYDSCLLVTTTLPSDIANWMEDCKIYHGPILINNKLIMGLSYYITYRMEIDLSAVWGLRSVSSLTTASINDIFYDSIQKQFVPITEKATTTFADDEHNKKQDYHMSHDCGIEKDRYYHNPFFVDCYHVHLESLAGSDKNKVAEFISEVKKKFKGKSTAIYTHYILQKYEQTLNQTLGISEIVKMVLNSNIGDFIKFKASDLNELNKLANKKGKRLKQERFGTNDYCPIDKSTIIYENLQCLFKDYTDKVLNRGFHLSEANKSKLLFRIKSEFQTYEKMYEKLLINTQDYKALKIIFRFIRLNVSNSQTQEKGYDDDYDCFSDILKRLNREFLKPGMNLDKLFEDDDIEYIDPE